LTNPQGKKAEWVCKCTRGQNAKEDKGTKGRQYKLGPKWGVKERGAIREDWSGEGGRIGEATRNSRAFEGRSQRMLEETGRKGSLVRGGKLTPSRNRTRINTCGTKKDLFKHYCWVLGKKRKKITQHRGGRGWGQDEDDANKSKAGFGRSRRRSDTSLLDVCD